MQGTQTSTNQANHRDDHHFCTPEEAAAYLSVTPQEFAGLCKQFGIGRYHLPRTRDQIVYALADLDNVKGVLAKRVAAA